MATVPHEEPLNESYAASEEESSKERPSTLGLVRNVVLNLTQVVEDSMELVGASVREELAEFRVDMARQLMSLVAVVIGGSLATAGLAMPPQCGHRGGRALNGAVSSCQSVRPVSQPFQHRRRQMEP